MDLNVNVNSFSKCRDLLSDCERELERVRSSVRSQKNSMSASLLRNSGASYQLEQVLDRLSSEKGSVGRARQALTSIERAYRDTENKASAFADEVTMPTGAVPGGNCHATWFDSIPINEVTEDEGGQGIISSSDIWNAIWDLTEQFGPAGGIISALGSLLTGGTIGQGLVGFFKHGVNAADKIMEIVTSSDPSFNWRNIFGVVDDSKTFTEYLKGYVDDLFDTGAKTAKNIGKTAVKWLGVALEFICSGYDNFVAERDGNSNARALSETLLEGSIDLGMGILIAALLAPVGAPAVAVGALGVLIKWGIDTGSKAITEHTTGEARDFSEVITDGILGDAFKTEEQLLEAAGGGGGRAF